MHFVEKSIALLGLGLETTDILHWLSQHSQNCSITVFDQKSKSDLADFLINLPDNLKLHFSLGSDYLKPGLSQFDFIFRSPGFHRLHPDLLTAQQKGVKILSATKLFFQFCPCPIIGVTGTKGKGTTTTLIANILKASDINAYVAGNIGQSSLKLLDYLKSSDWVCLELSSFQLQDLTTSPHLAVVLNITSEHLDMHQSVNEYRQAKVNLVRFQTKKDLAVINADYPFAHSLAKITQAQVYWFSRFKRVLGGYVQKKRLYLKLKGQPILIGSTEKLKLKGQHNWENIIASITAARLAGASIPAIKKAVYDFKGLEHRLELVKAVAGIEYYNDSFSTTPETAIAAIKSFSQPTILILGGSDKGSDYTRLGQTIATSLYLKAIILIGQMAQNIEAAINRAGRCPCPIIKGLTDMKSIVIKASHLAQPGSVVVLSPACASFDMFKNYKDRGLQFKQAVKQIKKS